MRSCVFCRIVDRLAPAAIIDEDEATLSFLDISPATEGHTLVVPKRHSRDLYDVTLEDLTSVTTAAHRVAQRLRDALAPDGLNILNATGAAAFQTVFHLHLHLVPRYRGDHVHLPWSRVPAGRAQLEATAARIAATPPP